MKITFQHTHLRCANLFAFVEKYGLRVVEFEGASNAPCTMFVKGVPSPEFKDEIKLMGFVTGVIYNEEV